MKKLIIIFGITIMSITSFAQWTTTGSDIYNSNGGNVGIGTTSPGSKLVVVGNAAFSDAISVASTSGAASYFWGAVNIPQSSLLVANNVGIGTTTPGYKLDVVGNAAFSDAISVASASGATSYFWGVVNIPQSNLIVAGDVGIGTTSPSEKLSVNGKIRAKEIKVETGWSDFVFDPSYKLRGLKETEQFIKENQHLPEIPSAKEVAENGINLGEMNAKLLQKIEELTLYLIEQNKEIKEQGAKMKEQRQEFEEKIADQQKEINQLRYKQ